MPSINDVVNALKAKVDELETWVGEQRDAATRDMASMMQLRSDLALAQLENHDLRNQLQVVQLSATEYDPAVDLQSVIDHLDVLMGRAATPAIVEPAAVEVISHDLTAPVDHAGEVAPLDDATATPSTVVDSTVEPTAEER